MKDDGDLIIDITGYQEGTLEKVRDALFEAYGVAEQAATDGISIMQNHGILFRERTEDTGRASDGFHTFDELYDHRRALTCVLATIASVDNDSWRSKRHHPDDDPMFEGYFIVGIELPNGMISYHYPLEAWDEFAAVPEREHAPKWDGHSSLKVVEMLFEFAGMLGVAITMRSGDPVEQTNGYSSVRVPENTGQYNAEPAETGTNPDTSVEQTKTEGAETDD